MRRYRVRPGTKVDLDKVDPDDTHGYKNEDEAREPLVRDCQRLTHLQDVFYAEHRRALLIVLQGMDTAGKDGTIKHVFTAINPSGCEVAPFKVPTEEEADHDFLWRAHRFAPRRGHITIFNRSHYEDVLVPFVHRLLPRDVIRRRYEHINAFERILAENDTVIVKFFLHISKDEQRKRLLERLEDPKKRWKFSLKDVEERKLWPRYQKAYERLLGHCSTRDAPWHIIPANKKWYRNLAVAQILIDTIEALRCKYPPPQITAAERKAIQL